LSFISYLPSAQSASILWAEYAPHTPVEEVDVDKRLGANGLWPSPITPASQAQAKRLTALAWDTRSETLVWLEGRSDFGMLVASDAGGDASRDLTPELSVRARLGYGGGDMTVANGQVFFASGNRLYRQPLAPGTARAITPAFGEQATPTVSPDGRWVLFVHSIEGQDCLAVVDTEGAFWPQRLVTGDDFYMQPTWRPDGRQVAWVSWRHPQMPWDGSRLGLATLGFHDGALPSLAGLETLVGDDDTSVFQPAFSPDGRYLSYVCDTDGWYNLYLYDLATRNHRPLTADEAEWGLPAWVQGVRTYCWDCEGKAIYACRNRDAVTTLWRIDVETGDRVEVTLGEEYTWVDQPAVSPQGALAAIASGPRTPKRIVTMAGHPRTARCLARAASEIVPPDALSVPRTLDWAADTGEIVHGLYYAPTNLEYRGEGAPPLVMLVHGGPTGQATTNYSAQAQFFATRGYAVLDLNYRGSSGHGRRYRNLLRGNWGLYDVDDAVTGARHLCEQGLADPTRLVIMGGSAGGYTVLQALIRYPGMFRAGLCLYGVTNLFTLASDTHKFEQHYLDSLIGPLPRDAPLYRDRSPIFHAERIKDPVAVFQGDEDRVVPPDQAETIVQALRRNGVPHVYRVYAGEGHGWRKAETIAVFYEDVLRFLKEYVLFA
jgi:dipeptidyl aminopeptidase/acylaminoacyl peptidase